MRLWATQCCLLTWRQSFELSPASDNQYIVDFCDFFGFNFIFSTKAEKPAKICLFFMYMYLSQILHLVYVVY